MITQKQILKALYPGEEFVEITDDLATQLVLSGHNAQQVDFARRSGALYAKNRDSFAMLVDDYNPQ